jgi:hypothetical protein
MTFMVTAEASIASVGENLNVLGDIAGKLLTCSGLRDVLKCVLAIGNSMNQVTFSLPTSNSSHTTQGTWKGGAKAIKLASLTRLSQTKSVDGKSTVMDYLIQVLTTRSQNGDLGSIAALNLDEELRAIHQAKNISMTGSPSLSLSLSLSLSIYLSPSLSLSLCLYLSLTFHRDR